MCEEVKEQAGKESVRGLDKGEVEEDGAIQDEEKGIMGRGLWLG